MDLKTQRLILRNVCSADEKNYLEFHNSDFVLRYNAMDIESREQAQAFLNRHGLDDRKIAIAMKDTNAFVGMIYAEEDSLRYRANSVELSYWLGETFAGRGIMTEAMTALMTYLFSEKGYDSITVRVFADNQASRKLMRRLGFRQEGHLHQAVLGYDGRLHDDLLFSRRKREA